MESTPPPKESRHAARGIVPLLALAIAPLAGQAQVALQQPSAPLDLGSADRAVVEQCVGPTALVLSGGGARGLMHVGVVKVLDELGVRPEMVVGSSMGAIVGALWASYTGEEVEEIILDLPLERVFGGYEPRMPRPLMRWRPFVQLRQRPGGRLDLWAPVTREREAHILLNASLFRPNLLAGGDFTSLPVPLYVIVTDLGSKSAVTLSRGDLVEAVRASSSIPLVITPVQVDGRWLADGGLSANLPIEQARALGAEHLIVSDATDRLEDADLDMESTAGMAQTLVDLLFTQNVEIREGDVWMKPDLRAYPALGFSREAKSALIRLGYEAAREALGRSDCLPLVREDWRETGVLTWGGISPDAPRSTLVERIERATEPWLGEALEAEMNELRDAIMDVGSASGDQLTLNPSRDDSGVVLLEPQTRQAARRFAGVGGAYDHELGFSGWGAAVDRDLFGRGWVGSATAVAGGFRQELEMSMRGAAGPRTGITWLTSATVGHEDVRRFDVSGVEVSALSVRMFSGFVGMELTVARDWTASAGFRLEEWNSDENPGSRSTGGVVGRLERISDRDGLTVRADAGWTGIYRRFTAEVAGPVRLGRTTITPGVRVGWGRNVPAQLAFPLSGHQGFPGLHIGEGRGDREVLFRLGAKQPVAGPIYARLEVASGIIDGNAPGVPSDEWLLGARAGLGLDTFFGPITAGYGWMGDDREALFIRVGVWY